MGNSYGVGIFVDIDDTICTGGEYPYYDGAKPIQSRIDKINKWYDDGYKITYFTARASNQKDIVKKATAIGNTTKQLYAWGCKFHDIIFKKPVYNVLIDDRCENARVLDTDWEPGFERSCDESNS